MRTKTIIQCSGVERATDSKESQGVLASLAQRLILFLALIVMGANGAWAVPTWTANLSTSAPNENKQIINVQDYGDVTVDYSFESGKGSFSSLGFTLGGNGTTITITLPEGKTFKAGDKFDVVTRGGKTSAASWVVIGNAISTTMIEAHLDNAPTIDTEDSNLELPSGFVASRTITLRRATSSEKAPDGTTSGGGTLSVKSIAYTEKEASGSIIKAVINGNQTATVTGTIGGTVEKSVISSSGKLNGTGAYILVTLANGTFKAGDKVNINLHAAGSSTDFYVFNSKNADETHRIYNFAAKGSAGNNEFTLTADADAICLYRDGTYCNWNGSVNFIEVIRGEYDPEAVAPKADFVYGYTTWSRPEAGDVSITLPAHKAGSQITLTVTPETGATVDEVLNGTYAANKLTFTAPAAGSNMTVTFPITKDEVTTEYSIVVTTEKKVGQNFDTEKRYSQILIDARMGDFQSGSVGREKNGLSYGTNMDYVPGLVAKAMIEAVDYYRLHKTATINDAKLQTWFNAVNTFGEKGISQNGKDGKSFDDLNAVKINFGLKSVFASNDVTGLTDNTTRWNAQIGQALTAIRTANTSYAIGNTFPAGMQGGWWHKDTYQNQMWGDGQYMGTALLAQIINDSQYSGTATDDWNLIAKQLEIYNTYAWDNTANLPHHAFAADKGTNATSHSDTWKMDGDTYHNEGIWARATGWYFMALVDVLEQMPSSHAKYNTLKGYLSAVAAGVKARQDATTGLWYQLPIFDETFSAADYNSSSALAGRKFNYLESSASALFTAAYLKAMRLGLLDKSTYEQTAKKAYQGFVENFIDANNNIYWSCRSAGLGGSGDAYKAGGAKFRDGSNAYYLKGYDVAAVHPDENLTEGKALGAFIMAAVEYEREYLAADELVCGDDWQAQKTSTKVLASGQTMHITFHNVSNKPAEVGEPTDGWHNWILAAGTSDASNHDMMALRADNYEIIDNANTAHVIRLEGGNFNWATFVEDMKAGADVDLYVSNNGSNLYVKAVSTANNSGNVYTYTAQNSNSAENVYISLMGQNCTLTNIVFEDPVAAVTINATMSNTSARVKNGMGLTLANPSAVQAGETIVLEAKADDGYMFRTWKEAPAGTSIVASPSGDGYDYKYRIDALNASATVQAKGESTTVVKYLPTTNNYYYNFAIVDGVKDYVVEHGKATGDYDMLNFATITGGKTTLFNGGASDAAMVYAPAKTVNLNGSSAAYMKVELLNTNAEGYRTVQAGDVITFTGSGELKINNAANTTNAVTTTDKTYTVQEDDAIVGASTLYFFKNGSGQISTLNIMHPLPQHTITFNGNGNTGGSMEAQLVDEGIPTPIANNGFSRNAYILKGWNTAADGTGTDYLPGANITLTGDITLYAQWQRFSPMGNQASTLAVGGSITNYQMYFMTTKALEISATDFEVASSDETKATVELGGWDNTNHRQTIKVHGHAAGSVDVTVTFKGKEGEALYGQATSVVTFTVTAPDGPRTVSFDGGDHSSGSIAAMTEASAGSGIILPKITPYAGYTFLGWAKAEGASKPADDLVEGALYKPNGNNEMLYAVYSTGNTVGSANTGFFGAFSGFVKLDEGKSYSATYNIKGGATTYDNWTLIATTNNTGHNGDGVQNSSDNEIFCLRADGHQWKGIGVDGVATMYRSNDGGATYTELANVIASSTEENKNEFIEAMKNATNVEFSASRVGEYVYIYVTTTCSDGKRYIEKYKSGTIAVDQPVYLSWTTEKSTITFSDQSNQDAFLVSGATEANGRVNVWSKEGVDINNTAVSAGTQVTFKAIKDSGYKFTKWSDETTEETTIKTINATTNLVATFGVDTYHYTVRAVDSKGNVLNANVASGDYNYGDPAVTVAYPQHILKDNKLYEIKNNTGTEDWFRKSITPDRQNYVYDLVYSNGTVDNVVYYTEAEDISGFTSYAMTNRASNGSIAHSSGAAKATTCTLPAGLYQIFIRGCNGNRDSRAVNFTDGTNNIVSLTIDNNNNNVLKSSAIFQLTTETTLHVSSEGSGQSGLDWFYVKKYDDVLMVNENGQRYTLSKDNMSEDAFFTSTDTKNWPQKTVNGQKEYVLDMKSSRTETVRVTGARSYEIIVMNNGDADVNLSVGGENKAITAKSTSSTGLIPINDPNGVTSIEFTNTTTKTIYPYQIIFYTTDPEATLNTDEITVKVGKTTTFDLSTASGGAISYTSEITSNSNASGISFNGTKNQLTMTGVSEGTFDLTFDIVGGKGYAATTGYVLKVNVEKQMLTLKYSPEFYKYNADTREETNNLSPNLTIQIEDEETGKLVDFTGSVPTINYASDDETVAEVTIGGAITRKGTGQGSADITAVVNDPTYKSNVASFAVTIEQGVTVSLAENKTPTVGETLTVTDTDGETPLVYATFGGWKWGKIVDGKYDHSYDFPGSSSAKTDSWAKTGQYTGTKDAKPNYVDGYSWQSGGKNDAADEYKGASDGNIFGKTRYGWYRSESNDPHVVPFSLPVRGTYMTFEPQQNGMLTVYILQNGAFNSSTAADGSSKVIAGEFQPHSFHVVDQSGTPVTFYTDFTFTVKEPVTQRTRNGELIVCGYDDTKKDADKDNGQVPAGVVYDEKDVATWPAFYTNFSKDERTKIKAAWAGGKNGAQNVVELHDGSFFITQKSYVKYTFYVASSQTYYLFSNFSKMGFAGVNFIPDDSLHQLDKEHDILALNDTEDFPELKPASENKANTGIGAGGKLKLTIPQYGKITVNRTFTAGAWNTICLPFDMTEREVRENFGNDVEILCYDGAKEDQYEFTLHFVYHEIQSILAGYPYLIKPSKDVSGITVYNKLIQPKSDSDPQYKQPKDMVTFATSRYYCGTPYVAESNSELYTFTGTENYSTAAQQDYRNGDVYMSGGALKRRNASTASSKMKGYRAFLRSNNQPLALAKPISVLMSGGFEYEEDDTPTALFEVLDADDEDIENITVVPVKGVFNLHGQQVSDDLRSLPQGIYVVNGKKVYVK